MSRRQLERLEDIKVAAGYIERALAAMDAGADQGMAFDAMRMRFVEIGEAIRALDPDLLAAEPDVAWTEIAAMRNRLAHRYFDTSHAIVMTAAREELPHLVAAADRLALAASAHD